MNASNLSAEQVRRALLDQNYAPRASRRGDDLPPSLSTLGMNAVSKRIVENHTNGKHKSTSNDRQLIGFAPAEVRVAHYRWNPRRIEIPHPVAYSNLVETIARHWGAHISPSVNDSAAQFTVRQHPDGRIASMERSRPHLRPGVGRRFRVRADIASFYASIYTHAVPWAMLGKATAKTNRDPRLPANDIDAALRFARRGETTGISVGPGSSLIIAELLLSRVDEELQKYHYERFLDDYVAFTETETEAEEFVRDLDSSLREYGLQLNGRKTSIETLPAPEEPAWLRELRRSSSLRPGEMIDRALELSREDPQASAVQWALSRVRGSLDDVPSQQMPELIQRLAELAFAYPHTTPVLANSIRLTGQLIAPSDLDTLIQKHASDNQTSAVCWLLHLAWAEELPISDGTWTAVQSTRDSLSLAYLLKLDADNSSKRHGDLRKFLESEIDDDYSRDEAWPARYVAFVDGFSDITDPGFSEMRDGGVVLLRDPRLAWEETAAELYTDDEDDDSTWMGGGFSG